MRRSDRIALCPALFIVLGLVLGGCSADLSLNNVTLTPKPETLARKQEWATPNFDRPITSADLIGADGQCSGVTPGSSDPPISGGIALQMTECDVVRRAGPIENIESGVTPRGERSVVLTYVRGPWPGVYRFASGRLVSIERAPAPPAAEKPQKPNRKPSGSS
jgi:hypothetical protein